MWQAQVDLLRVESAPEFWDHLGRTIYQDSDVGRGWGWVVGWGGMGVLEFVTGSQPAWAGHPAGTGTVCSAHVGIELVRHLHYLGLASQGPHVWHAWRGRFISILILLLVPNYELLAVTAHYMLCIVCRKLDHHSHVPTPSRPIQWIPSMSSGV